MIDLAISAQKFPRIVTQKEQKKSNNPQQCSKLLGFYIVLQAFFYMFKCSKQTLDKNIKRDNSKTGERIVMFDFAISAQKSPKIVMQVSLCANLNSKVSGYKKTDHRPSTLDP